LPDLFRKLPELIGNQLLYTLVYDWYLDQQTGRLLTLTAHSFGTLSIRYLN
jgi:hypothetical protein